MSTTSFEERFQAQQARLPGPAAQQQARRDALDAFAARGGFPTRRDEAWHYTDLKPIAEAAARGNLDFAARGPASAARTRIEALVDEVVPGCRTRPAAAGAGCAVFVDGRLDEELSHLDTPPGVDIAHLATDWQRYADIASGSGPTDEHALAQLNGAFSQDGVAVRVARGVEVAAPLHVVFVGSGEPGVAEQPRLVVDLEPQAALTLVVHCVDAGEAQQDAAGTSTTASWLNVVTQISQAQGSRLSLYRLQEHDVQRYHTSLVRADLARDASFELGYVDLGGRLARNDIDVRLAEQGASATLFGIFLASAGQHIDDHIRIAHAAPHTTSSQTFRGIADGNGRGVFTGKVVVHEGAQRIDAQQSSDNLLLSDRAEIDTKPELEIYADDVKCSHGATVGELDPDHLFYLRSRGLDEDAARGLLTFAFANSVLRLFGPDALRERATEKVAGHLPEQGRWESLV